MGRERMAAARRKGLAIALAFFALGYAAGADRTEAPAPHHADRQAAEQVTALSHAVRDLAEAVAAIATTRNP